MGHGIDASNFGRCCSAFAARRLVDCDWTNNQDQYMAPDESTEAYKKFATDTLVFSIFESKSQQSSLRQVEYKGRLWDVENEFFWLPKKIVVEWAAAAPGTERLIAGAEGDHDRYMVMQLAKVKDLLSPEARAVIGKSAELVRDSMRYRVQFDAAHKEYQIMNWDCGWYQIKAVLKEYMPEALAEFRGLFRALKDRMLPKVYQLGFLRK